MVITNFMSKTPPQVGRQIFKRPNLSVREENKGVTTEHFYQKISDKYGEKFPEFVPQLIDTLPSILNFDKEQLRYIN